MAFSSLTHFIYNMLNCYAEIRKNMSHHEISYLLQLDFQFLHVHDVLIGNKRGVANMHKTYRRQDRDGWVSDPVIKFASSIQ